jgi:uncharacterized protein (DUF58 family)
MFQALKARLRRKADTWLFRLGGAEPGEVLLTPRRVFIIPARPALTFGVLMLVLLIGSINYNLGLGYALTFLVGTCAMVDMANTNRNLAQLHLASGRAQPVFAGEEARFELFLHNRTRRDRYAVWIDFASAKEARHATDVLAGGSAAVQLAMPTTERGWLAAPRVRLHTRFPLGLFHAWSYWQPDAKVLVYPFPEENAPPLPLTGIASQDGQGTAGQDDFGGIRSYQPGDPMRHLAWRQIARLDPSMGGQIVTKHFEGGAVEDITLDFDLLPPGLGVEARLSRMTRWVLEAEQGAKPYGFRLGATVFPPACGEAHQAACLQALALYGGGVKA